MGRKAQAQAQRQAEINATESFNLVRGLLRVSIFHVSYLRGLFPETSYRNMDMANLDGMNIRMLTPACDESSRLIDWVEKGVHDALQKGYLKTLFFGISNNAEGTELLEEYIFNFSHDKTGGVHLDMSGNGKDFSSVAVQPKGSASNVKFQVVRLMRMLVQICQTLDYVPPERYLFMKMNYHLNTPDEYEPPGFRAMDEEKLGYFSRKPFAMDVGTVATPYHGVVLRVKSMLDSCGYGSDSQREADQQSMQNSTMRRAASRPYTESGTQGDDCNRAAEDLCGSDCAEQAPKHVPQPASQDEVMLEAGEPGGLLASVEAFCCRHSTVQVADILAHFLDLPQALLDSHILPALIKAGVLQATAFTDKYEVLQHHGGLLATTDLEDKASKQKADMMEVSAAAERLQNLSVTAAPGKATGGPGAEVVEDINESLVGRVQNSHAGTALTNSVAGTSVAPDILNLVAAAEHMPPESQPAEPVFFESQTSLGGGGGGGGGGGNPLIKHRARKASFVQQPIHQMVKRARTVASTQMCSKDGPSVATSRLKAPRRKAH